MTPVSPLLLLIGAVGGVVMLYVPFACAMTLLSPWFDVAKLFPAQPVNGPEARGITRIRFAAGSRWWTPVSYVIDADHLHLRRLEPLGLVHGAISLPWAAIERITANPAAAGSMMSVSVRGKEIELPTKLVQREIEVRRAMGEGEVV
jgi:hypothetical protein